MSFRVYLFAARTSPEVAMARYLATDHPSNVECWRRRWPFNVPANASRYDSYVGTYNRYRGYLSEPRLIPQLQESSWAWSDITGWNNPALTTDQRLASISSTMRDFILRAAADDAVPTLRWAHAMDPELASAWLYRAMQVSPEDIERMAPREQRQAVMDMACSFANYWKALNLSVQAWGRYRDAWEYAARPLRSIGLLLGGPWRGWLPRPCASPLIPTEGLFYSDSSDRTDPVDLLSDAALEDLPLYIGPWRAEAILMNNLAATRSGLREVVDYSGEGARRTFFGNIGGPQPVGPGPYGQPASNRLVSGFNNTRPMQGCQENVVNGSLCFAPMRESHFVWLNNDAMLAGGADPYWPGITSTVAQYNRQVQCSPDGVSTDRRWQAGHALDGLALAPVRNDWLTANYAVAYDESMFLRGQENVPNSNLWWLPPPKRYVELLWPLLQYLLARSAHEVAWEVMLDVYGKNTFSTYASGLSTVEQLGSALNQAMAFDREATLASINRGRATEQLVRSAITTTMSAVPVVGALFGAGTSLMFTLGDTARGTGGTTASDYLANAPWDVFGRPDAVRSGPMTLGMIERYAIQPIAADASDVEAVRGYLYDQILSASANEAGPQPQRPGLVTDRPHDENWAPWPAGLEYFARPTPTPPPSFSALFTVPVIFPWGATASPAPSPTGPAPTLTPALDGSDGQAPGPSAHAFSLTRLLPSRVSKGALATVGLSLAIAVGAAVVVERKRRHDAAHQ